MRKSEGITLVSLALTVLILAILAGTVIYNGGKSVNDAKKQQFVSELEMVQAKVNAISEKMNNSETEKQYYNSQGKTIDNLDQTKLLSVIGRSPKNGASFTTNTDGFRYFQTEDLEKIGLSGIKRSMLINFVTREVCTYDGLELDGKIRYKLKDLGHTTWNVEYTGIEKKEPTFTANVTKLSTSSWQITISDVVTANNVAIDTISYKLSSDTNWIIINDLEFIVAKSRNL